MESKLSKQSSFQPVAFAFLLSERVEAAKASEKKIRRPLTERSAQGRTLQPRRKVEGPRKQKYGRGGTALPEAVLSDVFSDENEIEERLSKASLGQAMSPLPSKDDTKPASGPSAVSVVRQSKEIQNTLVCILCC